MVSPPEPVTTWEYTGADADVQKLSPAPLTAYLAISGRYAVHLHGSNG